MCFTIFYKDRWEVGDARCGEDGQCGIGGKRCGWLNMVSYRCGKVGKCDDIKTARKENCQEVYDSLDGANVQLVDWRTI